MQRLVCVYLQVLSWPYRCRTRSLCSLIPPQEIRSRELENEETMSLNLLKIKLKTLIVSIEVSLSH
ncbi:hypothetical protein AXX17_AT1G05270 [Arabidopsis thaliana]|uniref:Uncharacterized protein n=1 Tax=Arabidopsis thaliana TaxID=3702 RepID=A0A178WFD0_ARATH|nr:hypothetical protein AXX17_AT1G05270 [Arabidopsis thaliana]